MDRTRREGILALIGATVLWSFPALAIEFLTGHLDIYTQNAVRIGCAAAFLWGVCLVRSRREALAAARLLPRVLPAFFALLAYQYLYVRALYLEDVLPGLAYMLLKSTVFFTAAMSCVLFADERALWRSGRFRIGATLSVLGVGGFIAIGARVPGNGGSGGGGPGLLIGVGVLLAAAVFWSLYTVLIKLLVRRGSALVSYTYVCTLLAVAFAALAAANGRPGELIPRDATGWGVLAVAVVSGVACVGLAHVCYYVAIRSLGTTTSGMVMLSNTFLTPLLSMLWFGERITGWHVLAGGTLVAGSAFTLLARRGRGRRAAETVND
jgi:drug/metabolite transporter (DMT)-like permease